MIQLTVAVYASTEISPSFFKMLICSNDELLQPIDLATGSEYLYMIERQRKNAEWFAAMESNILTSLAKGYLPGTYPSNSSDTTNKQDLDDDLKKNKERSSSSTVDVNYCLPMEKDLLISRVSSTDTVMSSETEIMSSSGSDSSNPSESSENFSLSPLRRLISKMSSMDDKLLSDRANGFDKYEYANRRQTPTVYVLRSGNSSLRLGREQ